MKELHLKYAEHSRSGVDIVRLKMPFFQCSQCFTMSDNNLAFAKGFIWRGCFFQGLEIIVLQNIYFLFEVVLTV